MAVKLTMKALGVTQIERTLFALRQKVEDLSGAWPAVHQALLEHTRKLFASEGATGRHGKWDRYTGEPKYKAFRDRILGPNEPILHFGSYSRLAPSLTSPSHPDHVFIGRPTRMEFGTRVPYADRLAQGGVGPFGERYPPRRAIDLTEDDAQSVVRAVLRHIRSYREAPGYNSDRGA